MAGKIKMSWPAGIALGLGAVASAVSAKEYSDWGGTVSVEDPVAFPDSSSEVNSSAWYGISSSRDRQRW